MISFLVVLLVALFIVFYAWGGQGHKWMKRFIAPGLLGVGAFVSHPSWLVALGAVLYLPLMSIFSYGEKFTQNLLWKKILFRGLCGLMPGLCGLVVLLGSGHWVLGVFQCVLAVVGSVIFGVFNPFPTKWGNWATVSEDVCIALSYSILLAVPR